MKRISGGGLFRVAAILLLLFPLGARAHNGAVTVGVPVEGIVVDGDLSDWPDGLVWNRLHFLTRDLPEDSNDLQGRFAVGYSVEENALYVTVEVQDESLVLEAGNLQWDSVDGCELYVDVGHSEEDVSVGQYRITGTVPGIYSDVRREDFRVAAQRDAGEHRYEWRVDIGGHSRGKGHLQSGMVLGLDIAVQDKDEDGSFTNTAWGAKRSRDRFFTKSLGDVMLVDPQEENGRVGGRLVRVDGRGDAHRFLELRSAGESQQWLWTRADGDGVFALTLAAGRYRLKAGSLSEFDVEVEVEPGSEVRLAEGVMPPPRGREVEAGPGRQGRGQGRTLQAGPGRWEGAWRTLGAADGIPDATVTDVFQDRDGSLWFTTGGGGVVRYDGEEMIVYSAIDGLGGDLVSAVSQGMNGDMWFAISGNFDGGVSGGVSRFDGKFFTAFTVEDGLPGFDVLALIQDARGGWWFGTDAGLCLFDGERFTTFTAEDGLPSDQVNALALDREGNLWIGTGVGVARFDGRYFEFFSMGEELVDLMDVEDLLVDSSGVLWVAAEPGIGRFDGGDFSLYTTRDGLASMWIYALLEDRDGYIWAGAEGGVNRFDGEKWTSFTLAGGLAHQVMGAICQDRAGDLWFGSGYARYGSTISGDGVSQYVGDEFLSRTTQVGIMGLDEDYGGRIWLGTWEGVRYYEEGKIEAFEPIDSYIWHVLTDRKGRVWFSTGGEGAYVYDGGDVTPLHHPGWPG